jgi:2'-5' RNA ligase
MAKYYTNFCFKGYLPEEFHCTHMYFGELEEEKVLEITKIISSYFSTHLLKKGILKFTNRQFFGESNDIPVLMPKKSDFNFHIELRNLLISTSQIQPQFDFNPHITTIEHYFIGEIDRYSLVKKDKNLITEVFTIKAT